MLNLIIGIFCSAFVGISIRVGEEKVNHNLGMLTMNYVVCTLLSGLYCGFQGLFSLSDGGLALTAGLGAFNGLMYLSGFILIQSNIHSNGVVLTSIFQKLGLLVTLVISVVFYKELPNAMQAVGFVLAMAAIFIIKYQKGGAGTKVSSTASLIWMLLVCGMADGMSKIFAETGMPEKEPQFLFYTFATALVLGILITGSKGQRIGKKEMIYGTLVAFPNFFASKFLIGALKELSAVIVYPAFSVGSILVVTLAGVVLFRERLNRRQWAGMAMILVALVLLNL